MARSTPSFLTALGKRQLPADIEVGGRRYVRRQIFKDDFFAVTAMYESEAGRVVVKIHRQAPLFLLPLGWVGRLLAARERAAMDRLGDLPGIPRLLGRWGPTGVVREYIAGRPLAKGSPVPDDFHTRLRTLISKIHERGMAYVDLEKCENVLVGDDGRPYLFDFQISWLLPARWGGELWPARLLRKWLQQGDRYHLAKLQRRTRPDQLSPQELAASYRKPWYVRVHRSITWPFTWCRRWVLDRLAPGRSTGERGRIADEETTGVT